MAKAIKLNLSDNRQESYLEESCKIMKLFMDGQDRKVFFMSGGNYATAKKLAQKGYQLLSAEKNDVCEHKYNSFLAEDGRMDNQKQEEYKLNEIKICVNKQDDKNPTLYSKPTTCNLDEHHIVYITKEAMQFSNKDILKSFICDLLTRLMNGSDHTCFVYCQCPDDHIKKILEFDLLGVPITLKCPTMKEYIGYLQQAFISNDVTQPFSSEEEEAIVHYVMAMQGDDIEVTDMENAVSRAIIQRKIHGDKQLKMEHFNITQWNDTKEMTLDQMVGQNHLKEQVEEIVAREKYEMDRCDTKNISYTNMLLVGNPGTGKSTFAKIVAKMLSENGISNGKCAILRKSDYVGKYVGHTEAKISELFEQNDGGVILFDESDSFLEEDCFTRAAIKEIVRLMEENPQTIVMFAIYQSRVKKFLDLDPGLSSRISYQILFKDYSDEEMYDIFCGMAKRKGYDVQPECKKMIVNYVAWVRQEKAENFANAREMRNYFDKIENEFAMKCYKEHLDGKSIQEITPEICQKVYDKVSKNSCCTPVHKLGFA